MFRVGLVFRAGEEGFILFSLLVFIVGEKVRTSL